MQPSPSDAREGRVYFDSHMHTPLCRHAVGAPEEYALAAERAGLRGIVFTCHCPMPGGFWPHVRMAPDEFDEYVGLVAAAAKAFEGRVDVRLGIESDYFPGYEDWIADLHSRAAFHHCLGSIHFFGPEYQEAFWSGDVGEFQRTYFGHLADAAETGLFDTLAHPDLIKNASPADWDPEALEPVIAPVLDRIAATGVAMELNTSGVHKRYAEMNPGPVLLRWMNERGIPVVIGSDSHHPGRVAEGFLEALAMVENAGYAEVSYFDSRKRRDVAIPGVRASLLAAMAGDPGLRLD